jgi:glutathione S-transferase
MSESKPKLVYFNGRGLAETTRLLFAVAGVEYEDFRYPLKVIDFSLFKFERDEFDADKAAGKLARSLHKLPYLEVDGQVIPQSKAIERYVARRYGLLGLNEVEAAQIDAVCEYVKDFKADYQKVRALKGEEREEGMKKWFGETLPEKLGLLDLIVPSLEEGSTPNLAHVTLYNFLAQFFDDVEGASKAMSGTTNIKSVVETVGQHPGILAWLKTRPETPF